MSWMPGPTRSVQKGIVTTGSEKKQLTTKLTDMQQTELRNINNYRAEVGVAPLEYDAALSPPGQRRRRARRNPR